MNMGRRVKLISMIVAAAMLLVVQCAGTFAAVHDSTEDVSSETATITLGKELTYINRQKNPVTSVTYTIEKVQAWENDSVSTSDNGKTIAVSEMPSPSSSEVEIPLTDNGNGTASGKSNITIRFTKAGYYLYKIKETPVSDVPGAVVTSDTHEYFAVIYVCNKTDGEGNTVPGVYVHDITSYRNESGSSTYKPTLTDIAKTTDNGGTAANENTNANLGKVGKSSPSDPDTLEAYRMWNTVEYPEPIDLTVTNNVTGPLGDVTKEFEFTVELSGLEKNAVYTTYGTATVQGEPKNGLYAGSSKTLTSDADGKINLTVVIKDDQSFTIEDIPKGTTWNVTEGSNNHIASYEVTPEESAVIASKANTTDFTELPAGGTANSDTVADFTNERDIAVVTGVPSAWSPYIVLTLILLAMTLAAAARKGHKSYGPSK